MASWAVGIGEFYMDGQNYSLAPFEKMCDRQRSFVMDAWKIPKSWINPSMVLSPEDPNKVSRWKFPFTIFAVLLTTSVVPYTVLRWSSFGECLIRY